MKITLTDVKSGYNLTPLNSNFQAVQTELQDKVLYRDNPVGEPNQMEGPLDLNNNNLMNVNQLDVVTFKIQGEDSTQFLNDSVVEAFNWAQHPEDTPVPEGTGSQFSSFHYSLKAEDSATAAKSAETNAELALFNFNGTWYGALASEPTVDSNGNAPTDGDIYLNSTTGIVNFFLGGTWNPLGGGNVTSVHGRTGAVISQSGDYTATELTYDNATSGLTATETQAAIDELSAEKEDSANLGTAATKDFGTVDGNLPEYREATVALGGDFLADESVKIAKIGNVVTVSAADGELNHTSLSEAFSAVGAIPSWAVPNNIVTSLIRVDTLNGYAVFCQVDSNGRFLLYYVDNTFTAFSTTSSLGATISYVV